MIIRRVVRHTRQHLRWNSIRNSHIFPKGVLFSSESKIRGIQRGKSDDLNELGRHSGIENVLASQDDLLKLNDTTCRSGTLLTHVDFKGLDGASSKQLKSDLKLWFDEHTGDRDFSIPENVLRQVCYQIINGDIFVSDSKKEGKLLCVIIDSLAKSSSKEAAQVATDVLEFLENAYQNASADDLRPIKPTVFIYTTVIDAWARSNTGRYGAMRAEEILDRMLVTKIAHPNVYTYTALINAWGRGAKYGDRGHSADMALEKLESIKEVLGGLGGENAAKEKHEMSEVAGNFQFSLHRYVHFCIVAFSELCKVYYFHLLRFAHYYLLCCFRSKLCAKSACKEQSPKENKSRGKYI